MFPADHWRHHPALKPVAYDPALSKKLLAEAVYKNGLTVKGYMLNTPESQTLTEAVKGMLGKVGIDWKVEMLDPAAIVEKLRNADYEFAGGWTWIYDPDIMATGLYHPDGGFNFGRSNNPRAIALIEKGHLETDDAKRTKIHQELDKVLYDNCEDVWRRWLRYVSVVRKNVMGINEATGNQFKEAFTVSHPGWFKDGKENRDK
jgi:peptide/nickel transport system substrate-binding protein